jgi:hypothetical protein
VLDILGVSGHKPGLRHPGLVLVPWATVDGERRRIVDGVTATAGNDGVQQRLRDLGYQA